MIEKTFIFIYSLTLVCADIEYAVEDSRDGDLSNQAFTNLENELCQDEHLWKYLRNKIDKNNDSVITIGEMEDYLWKRTKELNLEEMDKQLAKIVPGQEKKISFEAHVKNVFEEIDDLNSLDAPSTDEDTKDLKILFTIEKNMWIHLAGGVDQKMDLEKFYQLTYPHEFPEIKTLNERLTFEAYDTDKNGFLSVDEFLEFSKDVDETIVKEKRKKFTKKIDLNADNRLDLNEFKKWNQLIAPSLTEIINDERNYLLNCCDENDDLKFNQVEVDRNCESFLHSLVTNYSLDIRKAPSKPNNKMYTKS
ncbi:Calumenin precursor (Crocalbin) [Brachionus plicatilis]|uniref:Calumenin (Crocalbin) n=1 Tax=Brachionus plicatilis TaxID=10195 RepID=A0A3M7S7T3_BRAPC|nr:Calumenin precursor (Crocalbin) [Brachionus plicatilis]